MIQYPIAVAGTLTRVLEAGHGERTVIFTHGLGARADRWRATVERFAAQGYRAVAWDLPGHGFAEKRADFDYSVPSFSRCLGELLEALAVKRAILIGTSLGGHISAHFACRRPDAAAALVLVGALGLVPLGEATSDAIRRSVQKTGRSDIEAKMRFVLADPAAVTPDLVEEEWRFNNSPGAGAAFKLLGDYIASTIDRDVVTSELAALAERLPTLLVWGDKDQVVPPAIGREAALRLRLAPPTLIGEAGHAPHLEQPAAFDAAVLPFLADLR